MMRHSLNVLALLIMVFIDFYDAFFQPELGWSVWGSLGRTGNAGELGCRLLNRLGWNRITAMLVCGLWVWHSSVKIRKKGGRRGLCPWSLRGLSQFLSERKDRLLRGRMCCICVRMRLRTFDRRGGHVFIVDIRPVR